MKKSKLSQIGVAPARLSGRWSLGAKIACALLGLAACSSPGASREYLVHDIAEYEHVVPTLAPGDVVTLADGEWKNFEIMFEARGTREKPVTLQAQTKGRVLITGRSNLRLAGEYLVVSGLVFRDGYSAQADLISFRRKQGVTASNSRLTEIVIDGFSQPDPEKGENWISLYGHDNRLDHSHILGKRSRGVTVAVIRDEPQPGEDRHRIDHNYFGPRPPLGTNGGETIRVGTSQLSKSVSATTVEDNYFEECDGEAEIISIKSGGNIVRGNVVVASQGSIVLRHGDGNLIERNVILGKDKANTGGIRVINAHQTVRNNYVEGVTGVGHYGALAIMNGSTSSPLSGYAQVADTTIDHNSFVDVSEISIGTKAGSKLPAAPIRSRFEHNLITGKEGKSPFAVVSDAAGIAFKANVADAAPADLVDPAPETVSVTPLVLTRAANGLLYPDRALGRDLGAPRDLDPVARTAVGVSWYPLR